MGTKILIPAALWFLSIFNFAGYDQQIDEEQSNEICMPTQSKGSGNTDNCVSPPNTYVQKQPGHQHYGNKKIVFRHLMLTHNGCDGFNSNSKQRTGG